MPYLGHIVLLIDHTALLTDAILVLDTDPVLIQEIAILHDTLLHLDFLQDQDIPGNLDPVLALKQETESIQYNLNHKTVPSNLKYICTEMANALTPKIGFTH